MTEQDIKIQDLRADNEKLRKENEQLKQRDVAISRQVIDGKYYCTKCGNPAEKGYCRWCGRKNY